jgi:hypothetical protein
MFFPAADTIAFSEGGTEAMRLDSAGNVGIGVTPSYRLDVATTSSIVARFARTSFTTGYIVNGSGETYFSGDSSGNTGYGADSTNGRLVLWANSAERMRITSAGNLLLGATSGTGASERLYVYQDNANWINVTYNQNASPYGVQIWYNATPNNSGNQFLGCFDSAGTQTQRASIRSNGGLANYSANNVNLSDAREKTNIELAGSYLDKICAIPVKTFNYIDQNLEEDDGLTLGVLAQDVQAVAPEFVMESNWAGKDQPEKMRLSIYQTDLQYALMKSIQELKAIVEAQAVRIAELEGAK